MTKAAPDAAVREHGLLFKSAMVRRLLADAKQETRRPITCHNSLVNGAPFPRKLWPGLDFERAWIDGGPSPAGNEGPYLKVPFALEPDFPAREGFVYRVYPKIQAGDRVWCRETWSPDHTSSIYPFPSHWYRADFGTYDDPVREQLHNRDCPGGGKGGDCWPCADERHGRFRWRSALLMPRRVCRVVLDVHAQPYPQRIGDITPEQEALEGFPLPESDPEGPCTFADYFVRIHGAVDPRLLCWTYPIKRLP